MKPKITLFSALFIICASCSPTKWFFSYNSKFISCNINEQVIDLTNNNSNLFSNDSIDMFLLLSNRGFNIKIKNKTNKAMFIDWDQISYVGIDGSANRVIHRGVKFINKSNTQEKTIIPPNTSISDEIIPTNNIQYNQALPGAWGLATGQTYTGWSVGNIFPYYTKDVAQRNAWTKYYIGRSISLYMPIEIDGSTTYYSFNFIIDKINITQHNPDVKYEVKEITDFLIHSKR